MHAIERAHGYVAQGAGYFCGWLFSDSFARIELTNLSFYVRDLTSAISEHWDMGLETQVVERIRDTRTTRQRIKRRLGQWVPPVLKEPMRTAYHKARGIGR